MSVLSGQSIRALGIIRPFHERTIQHGMSFGVGPASYDVRSDQSFVLKPKQKRLASTMEHFIMPDNVIGFPKNKSTWARRFVDTSFNTVLDPGWDGFLTLEIINHGDVAVAIQGGDPIAQIVFHWLDVPTDLPYLNQKYSNQPAAPVSAILQ